MNPATAMNPIAFEDLVARQFEAEGYKIVTTRIIVRPAPSMNA